MALRLTESTATVSIIVPCFNARRWLRECVESCVDANPSVLEVIVIDDGSSDDPESVINALPSSARERVRYVRKANAGAPTARQRGLELSRGEWVMFLDADDVLKPGTVDALLARSDEADAVYGDVEFVDENRRSISIRDQTPVAGHSVASIFFRAPLTGSVILRKSAVRAPWAPQHRAVDEFFFFAQAAVRGARFRHVALPVYEYRQHDSPHRLTNQQFDYPSALGHAFLELDREVAAGAVRDASLSAYVRWIFLDLATRVSDSHLRGELLSRADAQAAQRFRKAAFALRWYGPRRLLGMLWADFESGLRSGGRRLPEG